MASVAHLFRAPKRRLPMEEMNSVGAIEDRGFVGCIHGRKGSQRQILLVDLETLHAMDLLPGSIRENITTEGLNVNGLAIGEQVRVGPVLLQISAVCTPCDQLEKVRPGLRREIYGRRGMLCRVLQGGIVRKGDGIRREAISASA